jgi:hypothetical protein
VIRSRVLSGEMACSRSQIGEKQLGFVPSVPIWCHWSREYNTTIRTTTTYLVEEVCGAVRCGQYAPVVTHYLEKETTSRTGTTTKTWDSGTFTLTGFDSDFLEELYCNKHRPPE